jgi:antitoxin (DNA-binding transcriptional repressor) of toxin-antitoxin stability system
MDRIDIGQLGDETRAAVRCVMAGERLAITIDGMPAAQLGPLNDGQRTAEVQDLIRAGLLRAPRSSSPTARPRPRPAPGGHTTSAVLRASSFFTFDTRHAAAARAIGIEVVEAAAT